MAKTCSWCHKETRLPKVFAAQSPLLEWMEEKINTYCEIKGIDRKELWGEDSDWGSMELSESFEMELITYDELTFTVNRKHICRDCLLEDDKMYKKYYLNGFFNKDNLDDDLGINLNK
jgi:hypothetical protein